LAAPWAIATIFQTKVEFQELFHGRFLVLEAGMVKDNETNQKPAAHTPISRRDFAKGSMAVLGAYTSFAQDEIPPLPAAARALKIDVPEKVQSLLDERGILEDDVRRVIEHAERTGLKLYHPENKYFLSKLRLGETMFYVEYLTEQDTHKIYTAYTHRFKLGEEE
jgi:hypothetical protein